MLSTNRWLRLASWAAAPAISLAPAAARAQTIDLNPSGITRSNGFRDTSLNPTWISFADCARDDVITFPLTVSGDFASYELEVWAGTAADCTDTTIRTGASPQCWLLWKGVPTSTTPTAQIHVRDVVGQHTTLMTPNGPGSGTLADCSSSTALGGSSAPQQVTVYFMFVQGGATGTYVGTGYQWVTKYDLVGPTPPSVDPAGVGDTLLVLTWGQSTDTDLAGYQFFCDGSGANSGSGPLDAATDAPSSTAGGDAAADVVCPDSSAPSDASVDGNVDAAPATPIPPECLDSGSGGSGSDTGLGASACPSVVLLPGSTGIPAQYVCGGVSGATATNGSVTGLADGTVYSVGIAGIDGVGNVGPLSNVVCAMPQPVDDFYKLYREAGGEAGGGFCSVAGVGRTVVRGSGLAGVELLAALALLRRRLRVRAPIARRSSRTSPTSS